MTRIYNFNNAQYKVKFLELDSGLIYNKLEPSSEQISRTEKERPGFFSKLEESILKEGIRNPISISCLKYKKDSIFQWASKEIKFPKTDNYIKDGVLLICRLHGGSRLWTAQKYNLKIPCLVADFADYFTEEPLTTKEELFSCFQDRPKDIQLREFGIFIESLPHYHLRSKDG